MGADGFGFSSRDARGSDAPTLQRSTSAPSRPPTPLLQGVPGVPKPGTIDFILGFRVYQSRTTLYHAKFSIPHRVPRRSRAIQMCCHRAARRFLPPPGGGYFKRHKRHERHNPHEHLAFLRSEASRSVTGRHKN